MIQRTCLGIGGIHILKRVKNSSTYLTQTSMVVELLSININLLMEFDMLLLKESSKMRSQNILNVKRFFDIFTQYNHINFVADNENRFLIISNLNNHQKN